MVHWRPNNSNGWSRKMYLENVAGKYFCWKYCVELGRRAPVLSMRITWSCLTGPPACHHLATLNTDNWKECQMPRVRWEVPRCWVWAGSIFSVIIWASCCGLVRRTKDQLFGYNICNIHSSPLLLDRRLLLTGWPSKEPGLMWLGLTLDSREGGGWWLNNRIFVIRRHKRKWIKSSFYHLNWS